MVDYFDRYDADVDYGDLAYIDVDSIVTTINARPSTTRSSPIGF